MSQDDFLFRHLLRVSVSPSPEHQARYAKGMFTSYLYRAEDAAIGARAYATAMHGSGGATWRLIGVAAENLFKAIRVSHGLSATRSTSLRELLDGHERAVPLPADSPWRPRLAAIRDRFEAQGTAGEPALEAIGAIELAIQQARRLPPPPRSSAKRRASPMTIRTPGAR